MEITFNSIPLGPYICVNELDIDSGKGLSPVRRQAITWTNAALLSIEPLGTNFSEIRISKQNCIMTKPCLPVHSVDAGYGTRGSVSKTLTVSYI